MSPPPPNYSYLLGLIDDTGIFEHSRYGVPRREHGYTLDDAARALVLLCAAPQTEEIDHAQRVLLSFVIDSITTEGTFRNRMTFDRRWRDEGGDGDTQGRGSWALSVAAATAANAEIKRAADSALREIPPTRSAHLRPLAYSALGGHALFELDPRDPRARAMVEPVRERLDEARLPWPEERLTYANGRIPAALLAAGAVLGDEQLIDRGLQYLDWLVGVERRHNHFSFTPVGGWAAGEPRPAFDQQPIEAAAMADACERAWSLTRETRWREELHRCALWLLGENDRSRPLYDPHTGATRDGLMIDGVNANCGAESTISGLSVLQACQRSGIGADIDVRVGGR